MVTTPFARFGLFGLVVVGLLGCGPADEGVSRLQRPADETFAPEEVATGAASDSGPTSATDAVDGSPTDKQTRRIIYNTALSLVVEDYQDFEKQIVLLVDRYDGFVSHSETSRRFSDRQSGTWTIRVPVDHYSEFLSSVTSLGFAESRTENAQVAEIARSLDHHRRESTGRIRRRSSLAGRVSFRSPSSWPSIAAAAEEPDQKGVRHLFGTHSFHSPSPAKKQPWRGLKGHRSKPGGDACHRSAAKARLACVRC